MKDFPKLFIPGPTHVSDDILEVFSTPQIGHRTPEISNLILELVLGIQKVLYTKNHIYLASHPATGLWEMAIRNSVKKRVLHCVNGAFSKKWAHVSDSVGVEYDVLEYEWGKAVQASDIKNKLKSGKYDAVALVHNETSTGVMSDIFQIGDVIREFSDVCLLVDAVSSMAGIKIEVDKLGIDFILSSTQKAWGLPAGFSICSISERMLDISSKLDNKGYFLDALVYEKYFQKYQTPSTPSIPHLFGLKKVLSLIDEEGIENRWIRHKKMAKYAQQWAIGHGQSLFPELNCESETITCIQNDMGWDINVINEALLSRGYRMDRGYGPLRGKAFRIAHMGNIYMDDLVDYLNHFDEVLKDV